MIRIKVFFTIVASLTSIALADEPLSPAQQFEALVKQFQDASSSGRVLSDEERLAFVGKVFRARSEIAVKFLEIAEKYPADPIALDALMQAVWHVNTTPWPAELVGQDAARTKAFALLERDYIRSDKIGPLCQRVSFGFCQEYEHFLRAVLDQNPHPAIQAQACLALAQFLSNRRQRVDLIDGQAQLIKEFVDLFGREYLEQLRQQEAADVTREVESLLEKVIEQYADIDSGDGTTLGEKARARLFEMRYLAIGKQAPDIEGEDQDGVRFKLSDYRGKVVLLDFWSEY